MITKVSKHTVNVEDHPESAEPAQKKDEAPFSGTPWPIVEAIGPEEDVLSRLSVEGETGKPVESGPQRPTETPAVSRRRLVAVLVLCAVAAAASGAWYLYGSWRGRAPASGTFVIETRPPGAIVTIDGKVYGASPLTTPLPPGRHAVELAGTTTRDLTVTIEPGARLAQYVEMPEAPPPGRMHVVSNPPGAQVWVDGTARGVAPLDVEGLVPGAHTVALKNGNATVTQDVTVAAGSVLSLVVPLTAPDAGQPGFIVVASPLELLVFEGNRLLGTSRSDQIMMLAGRHDLRLANKEVGFETTRAVQVAPGRTSTVKIDLPNGMLFVNAVPWAEVFVDGVKIGETPIANHQLPVGSHDIVLRNPRFAEQRRTVLISLTAPARLGVDLRK